MKILTTLIIAAAGFKIARTLRKKRPLSQETSGKDGTLETKLEVLENCGFRLAPPFSVEDLLQSFDRDLFEEPGFEMVLVGLGMTDEAEPWQPHCVNLWHFDRECIDGPGSYVQIVRRMAEMTQGVLKVEALEDRVDAESGKAGLSFMLGDEKIRMEFRCDDDWVDAGIFARFVDLLEVADAYRLYVYYDLGGQDCLIGCVTRAELEMLNARGIWFVPLSGSVFSGDKRE